MAELALAFLAFVLGVLFALVMQALDQRAAARRRERAEMWERVRRFEALADKMERGSGR